MKNQNSKMTMGTIDFNQLPAGEPRRFVPAGAHLSRKEDVLPLYESLLEREISSQDQRETWLRDLSELEAAFDQAGSILYIEMTRQTDNQERHEAYKRFLKTVVPEVKVLVDRLNRKYLEALKHFPGGSPYYTLYNRVLESDIALFTEKNISLETQLDLLSEKYQRVCAAMTVNFRNEEYTLAQMAKFLLEPDRNLRETAWQMTTERRLKDKDHLEEIFDQMLQLRHQIARNTGCSNFCEYQFRHYHRFDYTSADCKRYHETVACLIIPLWNEILERRKSQMGLPDLRPWDLAVDPWGRPPFQPFQELGELIAGVARILQETDDELSRHFAEMAALGLLDLASRKGKAPGGYQHTLAEARKPFIFMNAAGLDHDVMTLLHEVGHAFHALKAASQSLFSYRHGPMEFCEVASMGMELMAGEHLGAFYNREDTQRSRISHLKDIVETLAWVATIDCFQFWIYENPTHTRPERKKAWQRIRRRFASALVDWTGLEEEEAYLWHRQLHIFEAPFYYIEYGIAELGALQLWLRYRQDPSGTFKDYQRALALGGSKNLPGLFETAGIQFDFSEQTIKPLMQAVREEIDL